MKCLNCGKAVVQKEGKREKKFCSDSCRATYHRKKRGPKVRWVGIDQYQKLQKELETERANRSNPLINAARGRDESGVNEDEVKYAKTTPESYDGKKLDKTVLDEPLQWAEPKKDNSAILAQIKAIEAEKIPAHRDTSMGRKSWKLEQIKRIEELKKQLQ